MNFRRPDKSNVQAIVTYRDGATAYLIVPTIDQRDLMAIARERQAAGEFPLVRSPRLGARDNNNSILPPR
jgi:hypothetical protein